MLIRRPRRWSSYRRPYADPLAGSCVVWLRNLFAERDPQRARMPGAGQAQDRSASEISGRFRARTPVAW